MKEFKHGITNSEEKIRQTLFAAWLTLFLFIAPSFSKNILFWGNLESTSSLNAQNIGINTDGSAAEAAVMLHVKGTNLAAASGLQNIFQVTSLDALSTAQLKLRLGLSTDASAAARYGLIDVWDATAGAYSNLVLQPVGGNVGIGTTTPGNLLEIAGLTNINDGSAWGTGGLAGEVFGKHLNLGYDLASSIGYVRSVNRGTAFTELRLAGSTLSLWTGPVGIVSQAVTVDPGGNVGIGTTTPGTVPGWTQPSNARVVEVSGDGSAGVFSCGYLMLSNNRATATVGDEVGAVHFAHKNNPGNFTAAIASYLTGSGGVNGFGAKLVFSTKADNATGHVDRMIINQDGYVGIATMNPSGYLQISPNYTGATVTDIFNLRSSFRLNNAAATITNWYGSYIDAPAVTAGTLTNKYALVTESNAGNVGIGCIAPQYKLHVIGDIASSATVRGVNAYVTGAITACSDIRYKKNIVPLPDALGNLMKLQGVNYTWKRDEFPDKFFNDKKQVGFIAQDIEKIYPELVFTDADGFKSVDYSRLTPILVEAIKEQQKKINSLDATVQNLQIENKTLMSEHDARLKNLEELLALPDEKVQGGTGRSRK